MAKTILFVSGFRENIDEPGRRELMRMFHEKGYGARFVPIKWSRSTLDGWLRELEAIYEKYDANDVILAGFSFGAMTAFLAAARRNPSELWLFSLSPYFAEDMPYRKNTDTPSDLRDVGARRIAVFGRTSFRENAEKILCPTKIFMGEKEPLARGWGGHMLRRFTEAGALIKNARKIVAPNVGHDVSNPNYIGAIRGKI